MSLSAGVSSLALILALQPAGAQTYYPGQRNSLFVIPAPVNGRAAYTEGFIWETLYQATSGQAGPSLNIINNSWILNKDPTQVIWRQAIAPSVVIGSEGGKGGDGLKRDAEAAAGGAGGNVTVVHNASMALSPAEATMLTSLVSIYSRGGKGGAGVVGDLDGRSELYASAGGGGAGGDVTATVQKGIDTQGDYVGALHVMSRGGNGGDHGRIDEDEPQTPRAGTGGYSGLVSVTLGKDAKLTTTGKAAAAIVVESIGGDGSNSANAQDTRGGVAGNAHAGSDRRSILYSNAGAVSTAGEFAPGVLLQSVGGAGGKGGTAAVSGRGTPGGAGGHGGNIIGLQTGRIDTKGAYSYGIVAQSVGGAGGAGGNGLASGGAGGVAGSGGSIDLTVADQIRTAGKGATAVVAQSVGGGKAVQAFQSDLLAPPVGGGGAGGSGLFLWLSSGGVGGTGGDGGAVTVNNNGDLWTDGVGAAGILAQSIGGGGGGGGEATAFGVGFGVSRGGSGGGGGNGGTVTVNSRRGSIGYFLGGIHTRGADAAGIIAESIGGGGGSGGEAVTVVGGTLVTSATALGGSGGDGGSGGTVLIDNGWAVSTSGVRSHGIQSMSIGGGGGDGGASYAAAYSKAVEKRLPNIAVAVAVGGSGGKGGQGGAVTVTNSGAVSTSGNDAFGIMGMSIGGGGGDGGISDVSATASGSSVVGVAVGVGVGGTGGGGGTGGAVTIVSGNRVTTSGDQSIGIVGYSIGGGGGAGGSADVTGTTSGKGFSVAVNVAVGGKGGSGNTGGTVKITNNGTTETQGYAASAIHALSAGGGGGYGGAGMARSAGSDSSQPKPSDSARITAAVNVGVGGAGGSGSNGGLVEVTNNTAITTRGVDARGILAQSIGGGGGVGGAGTAHSANNVQVNVAVGATGGGASDGGDVVVNNGGTAAAIITTYGNGAYGIQAQSVGGGGGSGGSASADAGDSTLALLGKTLAANGFKALAQKVLPKFSAKHGIKPSFPISVAGNDTVGGTGGSGGNGKSVTVTNWGEISTNGQVATAVFAQSIGGGGGNGGASTVGGGALLANMKIASGGSGGVAGDGGAVTVTNGFNGKISTGGASSYGIFAQSIGGGGGQATVGVDRSGFSLDRPALLAGGNGSRGNGGAVKVTNAGSIVTGGAQSHGIVAQSIGGGGGLVALNSMDAFEVLSLKTALTQAEKDTLKRYGLDVDQAIKEAESAKAAAKPGTDTLTLQLGGTGGANGNAAAVTIEHAGSITTTGGNAFGILAQSIGGGGGFMSDGSGPGINTLKVSGRLGGSANSFGDGSEVYVKLGAGSSIQTTGVGSVGILAQSIGGGGGYTGALNSVDATYANLLAQRDPSSGRGGGILVSMANTAARMSIQTQGKNAHGVFAQSVGGGGGAVGTAEGIVLPTQIGDTTNRNKATRGGGLIEIDLKGSIRTTGENSVSIYAQSGAQGGAGRVVAGTGSDIRVNFQGVLAGGSGTGAAVQIDGGGANAIEFQAGSEVSAGSGVAVLASHGQDRLDNWGLLSGDVNLAVGNTGEVNTFNNRLGGTYTSSARGIVNVGAAGTFRNEGTFNIGGINAIATANVIGTYVQTEAGSLLMDVSRTPAGAKNDLVQLTGSLSGTIKVNVVDGLMPGRFAVAEVSGTTNNLKAAGAHGNFSPFNWSVQREGSRIFIDPAANIRALQGVDMTASEDAAMAYLQRAWESGKISQSNASLFGKLANVSSVDDYTRSIDSITPEESLGALSNQTLGALTSVKMSLSCPIFTGAGTMMQETDCGGPVSPAPGPGRPKVLMRAAITRMPRPTASARSARSPTAGFLARPPA
ncbi:hypothetical protein [Bradyrhizobium sp. Leo121]|uniref:beta strand repeat-containing protein n=1 Tax=Bradyrhizobium sp. Leo121 TaxID=1571195 RepID=UPI00102A387A|nr:hypothetical protein [Bradyrhizobium sp. Leo121]